MANALTGLDRAVVTVADLDAAMRALARLGFQAIPREEPTPRQSLIFAEGAVDLVAGGLPGLSGVVLGSASLERSGELLAIAGPDLPEGMLPGLPAVLGETAVSDRWRGEGLPVHPNGAVALLSVTVVLDDPGAAMPAYDRLFGPFSATPTDDMVTVHTGRGLIFLVTPDGFDHLHPHLDLRLPAGPGPVALSIAVADGGRAEHWLRAQGVSFRRQGRTLAVPAADSLGIGLELVEA